ncbi:hypothetical protein KSP40_PGU015211 [Platanthera guangdongensis]|uniref:RNA polymerase II subunit B1 CTD phosphatase RPAP2 homolog n=1 Tax=Platanthera guangdongensis TaxID=2320717 RepID=A0ABR2MDX7_9ASPA
MEPAVDGRSPPGAAEARRERAKPAIAGRVLSREAIWAGVEVNQLYAAGSLLSRPDYDDVVIERSIAGLCGYPPCPNPLPVDRNRRGRFRISLREHRVYDLEETYNYCSESCVVRSQTFRMSLNSERVSDLSEAKIEQILRLFGPSKIGGEELEEGLDLATKSLSIKEKVDAGAGEVSLDEWLRPANAIEGYVPQHDRIGGNEECQADAFGKICGHQERVPPYPEGAAREREGARERASKGGWERGREGGRERGRERGSEGARERGSEGARERGSEGAREGGSERGSELARERGREGASEGGSEGGSEQGREGASEGGRERASAREGGSKGASERERKSCKFESLFRILGHASEEGAWTRRMIRSISLRRRLLGSRGVVPNFVSRHNSIKMTEGEVPVASSKFVSNETDGIHSKDYSAVKQDASKMISGNIDFPTSIIVGNEFDNWNASVPTGQDISHMIAKQLENVVLEEKNTRKNTSSLRPSRLKHHKNSKDASFDTENLSVVKGRSVDDSGVMENQSSKRPSKLSRPKAKKKDAGENNEKLVIESFAGIRDEDDALYSNQPTPTEVLSEEKTKSQGKILKSSLKASGSKVGSHSVKWADEENAVLEDKKIILQESSKEDYDISERFTSAEACAAALIQAAESVASGKTEVEDAVSEAGILIFPQSQPLQGEKEYNDDIHELDLGIVKWPKKTVLLDTDMFEVEDSWHDTTPEGFSLHLSPFATLWMALFGWINSSSLAYIYGYDGSSHQKFLLVNGKEYPAKVMLRDGQSLEIRQALDGFICRILPAFVKDQMISVPVSTMEKFMGCLLDTMSFMDAIPSFKIRQWHVIVFLFIEALCVHRLPILSTHFMSKGPQLQQILNAAQISSEEYEIMRDLILPFGGSADLPI